MGKTSGPWRADATLALVLALFGIVGSVVAGELPEARATVDAPGFGLVVVAAAALAARRIRPLWVLAAVAVCTSLYLSLGYPYGPILISFMIAVYGAGRYAPPALSVRFSLAALAMMLVHLGTTATKLGVYGVGPVTAWVVVPYALGYTLRTRQEVAERARAEAIRQSADNERLRVAQEVHDVVGHGLAAIKMQADIALHVLANKPEQAEIALTAISRTSSDALDELRVTLAAVRRSGAQAERDPVPGLGRLEELRQRMAEAGVYVRLETTGETRPLPVAVDVTGYRIIQESLTNVLRHSGAEQATVSIRYGSDHVTIKVSNPVLGPGPDTGPGSGSGIAGMRERVTALGGEFSAGPVSPDRFDVHARIPAGGRS